MIEPFVRLKASAGSGKTYSLARRYLSLLAETSGDQPHACLLSPPEARHWSELLAVTFTNKAADEMKRRIIVSLKHRALELPGGSPADDLSPERARELLTNILQRTDRLGVKTLDGLLHLVMRTFAPELGVGPDFEAVFDTDELFEFLMDSFCDRAEQGAIHERQLLTEALHGLLLVEQAHGFNLSTRLRRRLQAILEERLRKPKERLLSKSDLEAAMAADAADLVKAAEAMSAAVSRDNLQALKHFSTFLDKCRAYTGGEAPTSTYAEKNSLELCLKKASQGAVSVAAEKAYQDFGETYRSCSSRLAVEKTALAHAPFIQLADSLLQDAEEYKRRFGALPHASWASLAESILSDPVGAAEFFCRSGSGIGHILIDEFQDTSRDQWRAFTPLIEECLAQGGGFFYVGDVKQAVYNWRGGDARLFEEVLRQPELTVLAEPASASLPHNWRSLEAVREFNNLVFAPLANIDVAVRAVDAMLATSAGKASPEMVAETAHWFVEAYSQAAQTEPASKPMPGGFVTLRRVHCGGGAAAELEAALLEETAGLLDEVLQRRSPGQTAVLTRTNAQMEAISKLLIQRGVPVVAENSLGLSDHPLVRCLASFLSFLEYPSDDAAFLDFATGEAFAKFAGVSLNDLHRTCILRDQGKPVYLAFREAFPEVWQGLIRPFFVEAGLIGLYDACREVIRFLNLESRFAQDELFLRRFLELVHAYEDKAAGKGSSFADFFKEWGADEKIPLPESMDAVRVMTIHKAKGLEFPVVIAPFHHFDIKYWDTLVRYDLGLGLALSPLKREMGETFHDEYGRMLLEAINMYYVAWTRAAEELHCLLPGPGKASDKPPLRGLNVLLQDILPLDAEQPAVFGSPPSPSIAKPAAPNGVSADIAAEETAWDGLPPQPPMAWLPRLRIHRRLTDETPRSELFSPPIFDEKARGTILHETMRLLQVNRMARDPRKAAEEALGAALASLAADRSFPKPDETDYVDMLKRAAWFAGLPEAKALLRNCRRETTIIDGDGNEHRPDLLSMADEIITVVEFKTGRPHPEHKKQTERYMRLIRLTALQSTTRVVGLLVYLDEERLEPVQPEGGDHATTDPH